MLYLRIVFHETAAEGSPDIGASCTYYVSYGELLRTVLPGLLYLLGLYGISSIVMFIVSAVYSAVMLRPVDAIMRKIGALPLAGESGPPVDEFALISNAFDHMTNQMRNIDHVMHENKQLVRERLLSGILYNYVDIRQLSPQYEQNGIPLPHPCISIILISIPALEDFDDYTRQEHLKLVVRNNAADSDDFVLFSFQNEYSSSVDADLLANFTQCVIDRNMARLRTLTGIFRQRYLTDGTDLSEARRLTTIALGTIFTSLLELNVTVHEDQIAGYINKIGASESLNECDTYLFVCLSNMIDTETKIPEESRGYVRKAMDY